MKKRNIGLALVPISLAIGLVGGILAGRYFSRLNETPEQEKLRTILNLIQNDYVDEINVDSLLESCYPDLLASLDPHSSYIPASDFDAVNGELEGSFSGVGISFQLIADSVTVVEVIPGGPAEKVGIAPGDRIIQAGKTKLTGDTITNDIVFKTLRGPKGTKVDLTVKRSGVKKPINFDVIRNDIPVTSIDCSYIIEEGIGFIKVNKFARNTYNEFLNALSDLKSQGAKKYIIDLRDNGGGFMDQVALMANEFLESGRTIVYTRGRTEQNESILTSDGNGSFQDAEVIVLTNEYSASASEIFAGAMQDNDRGLVIGRRTFGKGLVQNQLSLPDSSAVRLTVARYYTPSGRCIQKEYKRGKSGKYELDIVDRYAHGEFYNPDSIKLDKSKQYTTLGGRTVYGGGGIMPDIFVPQDTLGYTSYLLNVANQGLVQKFAFDYTDRYRSLFKNVKELDQLLKVLPPDQTLLENFVSYAAQRGVPARWYYISQSRDVLLKQIKAFIARDILGYSAMNQVLNASDPAVERALKEFSLGNSPTQLKP